MERIINEYLHCDVCEDEFHMDVIELYNTYPVCSRCKEDLEVEGLALVDEFKRLQNRLIEVYASERLMTYEQAMELSYEVREWIEELGEIEAELQGVHEIALD